MFMIAANFISSWPMMALKGYTGRAAVSSFVLFSAASATAFDTAVRFALVLDFRSTLLEAKVAATCDTFEGAVKGDAKVIETDGYCAWRATSKNDL